MSKQIDKSSRFPGHGVGIALLCLLLTPPLAMAEVLPSLPEGIASFGAAIAGDDLVVYGGHVGRTHQHSIENLSHRFLHLDLKAPDQGWHSLGEVEGLQGLPMVAYGRQVCRVGGLRALNHVGSEEELYSTAAVRCFDLDSRQWRDLPPLPQARSSHDAVVFDDHLYVVGGWTLRGADDTALWQEEMAILDLRDEAAGWQTVAQPFQRRALAAAAASGKVYALGGLGREGTSRGVEVYDIASGGWSAGPKLPPMTGSLKGFGVSAFGVGERIFLAGSDGIVHALEAREDRWETRLGRLETARFFHRLLPHEDRLLFIAGAARTGHLDDLETLQISALKPGNVEPEPAGEALRGLAETASWPGFRGRGDGQVLDAELPLTWSDSENISWKASVPGYGQSAPVIWHGQVFVTSIEGMAKETLILSALSLETGEVRWRRRFPASQEIESSEMVSRGAPTPVVDGERVYAFFESGDLVALSHEGETLWQRSLTRDYGDFAGNHGVASSPVLTREAVVVQVTHDGPSYFLAVEKETGVTYWKADRPARVSWTTPVVVSGKNGQELISSAAGRVEGLDAQTGARLWYREGIEKNHVPSVTVDRGLVIVASSESGHNFALALPSHQPSATAPYLPGSPASEGDSVPQQSVTLPASQKSPSSLDIPTSTAPRDEVAEKEELHRLGAGELDDQHNVWTAKGVTSGFASPVVHGDCVLFTNKAGVVTCIDRTKGDESWRHRLGDSCWASPIVSGERAYFFTKKGQTIVLGNSPAGPLVLAQSTLTTEGTVYGVAAAHDAFLVRTGSEVIKIGAAKHPVAETVSSALPEIGSKGGTSLP
ncbi:MAG: PQQ-binding-like beta-propeller repeat protein [Deltaproteobacteria bacterium]|nr:PQQ-binding-like beta-propeller repeat protein [Deltaproteobacteria bacterium]